MEIAVEKAKFPQSWSPLVGDGDKKQMDPLPNPSPHNKIQTQISFSIYKHWGMSKFISLGYQIQERLYLGGSLST
ncbi:hypothetical protein PAL_GLEAN10000996 [Pteropus alecto]|uniref:Uncharacterized protein n=1 Tax=Pteropus alecto TaxID=9402 RepID=L5L689_PTEAL|nr:hypothetical protein PAL_GLEAN10000996 [Pteropus alecto]